MKHLLFLSVVLFSIGIFASDQVTGRASLTLWPDRASGFYTTEIRQASGKILGHTSFGTSSLVNLEVTQGSYKGLAGGSGLTSLLCTEKGCEGVIGGRSAHFTISTVVHGTGKSTRLTGAINHRAFVATYSSNGFEVSGQGHILLTSSNGEEYQGSGSLVFNPRSRFTARLKTSGSLSGLADPALVAIFLAAPIVP